MTDHYTRTVSGAAAAERARGMAAGEYPDGPDAADLAGPGISLPGAPERDHRHAPCAGDPWSADGSCRCGRRGCPGR